MDAILKCIKFKYKCNDLIHLLIVGYIPFPVADDIISFNGYIIVG